MCALSLCAMLAKNTSREKCKRELFLAFKNVTSAEKCVENNQLFSGMNHLCVHVSLHLWFEHGLGLKVTNNFTLLVTSASFPTYHWYDIASHFPC